MLLELERDLAGVMSLEDMSGSVLDKLQELTGAAGAALFSFDQLGAVSIRGGSLASAMSSYSPDLFPEDVLQQWSLRLPPGTFISDGSHPEGKAFDLPAHLRSRPYADFYAPADIAFVMGVWPTGKPYGSTDMFGMILTKPHPFEPFGAEVVRQLRELEQPLRLAARRIAQFRTVERKAEVIAQLCERSSGAFAIWDHRGHLTWASARAQRHLESHLRRSDLERAARLAAGQLRTRDQSGKGLLGRWRRLQSCGGRPMQVAFSWIPVANGQPWLLAELREDSSGASLLQRLTPGEARVLRLLVEGLSNAEIAARLEVGDETIKTHLKRIYAKLGVSSRSRAARLASEFFS